jgi:hypothetical protein
MFPVLDKKTLNSTRLDKRQCIKNQNIKNLNADLSQETSKFVFFRISFCKNTTINKNSCLSSDVVKKYFSENNVIAHLIIGNPTYNVQKYSDFHSFSVFTIIRLVKPEDYKLVQIYLSTLELKSNNGYILDSFSNNSSICVNNVQYDDGIEKDGIILDLVFFATNRKDTFHRSYPKLQTILANIGGLLKVFVVVFKYVGGFFSSFVINESILNKVYCFDFVDESNGKRNFNKSSQFLYLRKIKNKELNSIISKSGRRIIDSYYKNNSDRSGVLSTPIKTLDIYEEASENYINKIKKSKIHFNYSDVFKYLFPCCSDSIFKKKFDLFKIGYEKFDELLDVSYIIEKLEEIDKFKFITLKDEQLVLFNLLSKYFISPGSSTNFLNRMNYMRNLHNNPEAIKKTISEYFKKMKQSHKPHFASIIDKKLHYLIYEQLDLENKSY